MTPTPLAESHRTRLPWASAAGAFVLVLGTSVGVLGFLTGWAQPGKVVTADGHAPPAVTAITHGGRFEPLMPRVSPPAPPPPPLEMTASQVPSLRNVVARTPDPAKPPPTVTAVLDIQRSSMQTVPMSPTGLN